MSKTKLIHVFKDIGFNKFEISGYIVTLVPNVDIRVLHFSGPRNK